ncbi:MAG: DUF11 domain-containing protein [Ahniella sp.]|nr:DUF11 domain-containing protein [Ahniella sp.]
MRLRRSIPANQTTENMVVAAIDDALAGEPDETVVITLAAGTGYTVAGAPGDSVTGTIQDNDSAEVSIAVAPASVQEDDVTSLTYTVSVTNASVNPITVPLTFSGSATSGVDYTGTQASVTFPANSAAAQTVVIDPTADATVEADETVIVTLEAGAGYAVNAGSGSAIGSITNDDVSADLSYTITDSPDPVNTGGQVTYTVTVNNAGPTPAGNVQMSFQIPAGMTFVSLAAPGGWTCTTVPVGSGGGVGCFSASVAVGTSVFSIVAAVPPTSPAGTVFSASGDVTSPTFDPAPGNNAAAIGTTVVGGPQAIPGLDPFGRLMLVLGMLLLVAWRVPTPAL